MAITVIIVTGASRGFGHSLAVEFSRVFKTVEGLHVVLLSRDEKGLQSTAAAVTTANPAATVHVRPVDLSDVENLASVWEELLIRLGGVPWKRGILVNNAGSSGPIGYLGSEACGTSKSIAALKGCFELDIFSPIILSSLFLRTLKAQDGEPSSQPNVVVNVSSLAAVRPFSSLGPYSITRAARDMLHSVIAEESGGSVSTLNYAPGPMDSELQSEIRKHPLTHGPTKDFFEEMEEKGTWVDKASSAALCAKLVWGGAFKSGEHIDYYDAIKNYV